MSGPLHPEVHKALLVGVGRSPLPPQFGLPELAAPLTQSLSAMPPEAALWQIVAVSDLWQRAGATPHALAAGEAAGPDQSHCSISAEDLLGLLLKDDQAYAIESWLVLAARHGARLPHQYLPDLLSLGMRKSALRERILPLLDQRGAWMIAQNPEWRDYYGVAGEDLDAKWNFGILAERVDALRKMRTADPMAALEALKQEWPQATLEIRVALLPALEIGLSLADEAFLETTLDDKRKEVRSLAQALLAALPGSQLVQRCIARFTSVASYDAKKKSLKLTLPEAADKAMQRDGLGLQNHARLGEKASLLHDLVARIPPEYWHTQWNIETDALITLLSKHEFSKALLDGLRASCLRRLNDQRGEQANKILRGLLNAIAAGTIKNEFNFDVDEVLNEMTEPERENLIMAWLENPAYIIDSNQVFDAWLLRAIGFYTSRHQSWSLVLSRRMLECLNKAMRSNPKSHWVLANILSSSAQVIDVNGDEYYEQGWPPSDWEHWDGWRAKFDEYMATVNLRRNLLKSFKEITA